MTIYEKIITKQLPSTKVHDDDLCMVIKNTTDNCAKKHFIVLPKEKLVSLDDANESHKKLLGHMMCIVAKIARKQGLQDGYRTVINNGKAGV